MKKSNEVIVTSEIQTLNSEAEFNQMLERELAGRFLNWLTGNPDKVSEWISKKTEWCNKIRSQVRTDMLKHFRIKGTKNGNIIQAPAKLQTLFGNIVNSLQNRGFIGKDLRSELTVASGSLDENGEKVKEKKPNKNYGKFVLYTFSQPMVKMDKKHLSDKALKTMLNDKDFEGNYGDLFSKEYLSELREKLDIPEVDKKSEKKQKTEKS